jgi:aspartokinase
VIVMKFGGTSVKDAEAVRRVVQVVGRERRPRLVVVSALSKVTDALLEAARLAEQGDATATRQAVKALHRRHEEMAALVRATERRASLLAAIDALFEELEGIVRALAVVEEVSPRPPTSSWRSASWPAAASWPRPSRTLAFPRGGATPEPCS